MTKVKNSAPPYQIHYQLASQEHHYLYDQFNGLSRSEPVEIIVETMRCPSARAPEFLRPVFLRGLIIPTQTKGRPNAPEPACGLAVSTSESGSNYHWGNMLRNVGSVDMQKGHIMALELGGPDHTFNITPQWAMWQSNGDWREFEIAVLNKAKRSKRPLIFQCHIVYAEGSYRRSATPKAFMVEILDGSTVVLDFKHEQFQTETDEFVFLRATRDESEADAPDQMIWRKKGRGRTLKQKPLKKYTDKDLLMKSVHQKYQEDLRRDIMRPMPIFPGVKYSGKKDKATQKLLLRKAMLHLKSLKHPTSSVAPAQYQFDNTQDQNDLSFVESDASEYSDMEV